jgi:hypothetical protein
MLLQSCGGGTENLQDNSCVDLFLRLRADCLPAENT